MTGNRRIGGQRRTGGRQAHRPAAAGEGAIIGQCGRGQERDVAGGVHDCRGRRGDGAVLRSNAHRTGGGREGRGQRQRISGGQGNAGAGDVGGGGDIKGGRS